MMCIHIYIHIYIFISGLGVFFCLFLICGLYYKIHCGLCPPNWQNMLAFLLWFSSTVPNVRW